MNKNKWYNIVIWSICSICFLIFIIAASGKFSVSGNMYQNFLKWGYNYTILIIAGLLEALGAIFLLVPKLRRIGAYILIFVMLAAIMTHIINFNEMGLPLFPIAFVSLLTLILFLNKYNQKQQL